MNTSKKHYKLIAVDLSRQKKLDSDLKAIQQIVFAGKFKELDANDNMTWAGNDQSMFF